jgi:hypothetical protein
MSQKRDRKEEEIAISLPTTQCLLIIIICPALPLILSYPLAKIYQASHSFQTSPITHASWKRKAKRRSTSSKYVTSDEDTLYSHNYASSDDDDSHPSELVKNPNVTIKGLMKQVGARDVLLAQEEELLIQERKISEEHKMFLALEKGKVEKLDQELVQSKETTCSLKSSIGALQGQYDVLLKTHQDFEVQFDALWSSSFKISSDPKAPQASTSKGCKRCYNTDINAPCTNVEKVLMETCDEAIDQENDHLKREVKKLELEVNKLKK